MWIFQMQEPNLLQLEKLLKKLPKRGLECFISAIAKIENVNSLYRTFREIAVPIMRQYMRRLVKWLGNAPAAITPLLVG